jgi:Spy/CpxP family protein refolding chaperone
MVSDTLRGSKLLAMVVLVATFVAGALSGAAVHRVLAAASAGSGVAARGDGSEEGRRGRGSLDDRLLAELDLNAEQRVRVDSVLERRRREMEAFWDTTGPRVREIVDTTRAEIRLLLTPSQRAEYDRLREEWRREHREREAARERKDRP